MSFVFQFGIVVFSLMFAVSILFACLSAETGGYKFRAYLVMSLMSGMVVIINLLIHIVNSVLP